MIIKLTRVSGEDVPEGEMFLFDTATMQMVGPAHPVDALAAIKKAKTDRMRKASGEVQDRRALVAFLYVLARDHLTTGTIEEIIGSHVEPITNEPTVFTNGWLARWAQDVANRLSVGSN